MRIYRPIAANKRSSCHLCLEPKPLTLSHTIPRFFIEGGYQYFPTGKDGSEQPFSHPFHTNPVIKYDRRQKGYWERKLGIVERLLCNKCEQRFSAWEDYAKRFFYGGTSPIRLQLPLKPDSFFDADYKRMKLFQLSMLWRASEARGPFFSAVDLGEKHGERIRKMLLDENPGGEDDYPCALARLTFNEEISALFDRHGNSIENAIFAPVAKKREGSRIYLFAIGGLLWAFCVTSARLPEIMRNAYMKQNGRFFVLPFDGGGFLREFAIKVVNAGNVPRPS